MGKPRKWQRVMDIMLSADNWHFGLVYLHDIVLEGLSRSKQDFQWESSWWTIWMWLQVRKRDNFSKLPVKISWQSFTGSGVISPEVAVWLRSQEKTELWTKSQCWFWFGLGWCFVRRFNWCDKSKAKMFYPVPDFMSDICLLKRVVQKSITTLGSARPASSSRQRVSKTTWISHNSAAIVIAFG